MRTASRAARRFANVETLEAALLLAVATCPALLVAFAANPFDGHKALFVWTAIAAAIGALIATPPAWRRAWDLDGWHRLLVIALVMVLGGVVVSTAISEAPALAWWGSPLRRYGGLTEAALALMVLASLAANTPAFAQRLIAATIVGSVGPTIYGAFQGLGLDPVTWEVGNVRAGSTFGNPLFFAGYLVTVFPITAGAAVMHTLERRGSRWRMAGLWALAIVQAGVCVAIGSRGPLLALAAALAISAPVALAALGRRRASTALAGAIALAAVAFIIVLPARLRVQTDLTPDASGAARSIQTAAVRVILWRAAGQGIQERRSQLLFGTGPESTTAALTTHSGSQLRAVEGGDTAPDRVHNSTLETLLTFGLFGGLARVVLAAVVLGMTFTAMGLLDATRRRAFWLAGSAALAGTAAIAIWSGGGLWALALAPVAAMCVFVAGWSLAIWVAGPLPHPSTIAAVVSAFAAWLAHAIEIQLGVETISSGLAATAAVCVMAGTLPHGERGVDRSRPRTADAGDSGAAMAVLAGWSAAVMSIALAGALPSAGSWLASIVAATVWLMSLLVAGAGRRHVLSSAATWLAVAGIWLLWSDRPPGATAITTALGLIDRVTLFYVAAAGCLALLSWRMTPQPRQMRPWLAAMVPALAAGGLLLALSLRLSGADVLARSAAAAARSRDAASAVTLYQSAADRDPWNGPLHTQLADTLMAQAQSAEPGTRAALFDRARAVLERARVADPFEYHHARNLAALERRRASMLPPGERAARLAAADSWYREAIRLAPESGLLWAEWANLEAERGRSGEALEKLNRAAALGAETEARAVTNAMFRIQGVDPAAAGAAQRIGADLKGRGYAALAALYLRSASAESR